MGSGPLLILVRSHTRQPGVSRHRLGLCSSRIPHDGVQLDPFLARPRARTYGCNNAYQSRCTEFPRSRLDHRSLDLITKGCGPAGLATRTRSITTFGQSRNRCSEPGPNATLTYISHPTTGSEMLSRVSRPAIRNGVPTGPAGGFGRSPRQRHLPDPKRTDGPGITPDAQP